MYLASFGFNRRVPDKETQKKKQMNGILNEHYFRFDGTTKEKMR